MRVFPNAKETEVLTREGPSFYEMPGYSIAYMNFRMRGVFYRLAGRQAPLIDDVSGTLPPYDQFVCLGPTRVEDEVERMAEAVGCGVAIVDVNDLKRVKILAASEGVDTSKLTEALRPNPAGNGEEQTPVVVVRGCNAPEAH